MADDCLCRGPSAGCPKRGMFRAQRRGPSHNPPRTGRVTCGPSWPKRCLVGQQRRDVVTRFLARRDGHEPEDMKRARPPPPAHSRMRAGYGDLKEKVCLKIGNFPFDPADAVREDPLPGALREPMTWRDQ